MLEEGRISPGQLISLVVSFIIGSAAVLTPGRGAGHDQWVAALLALIEAIPVALTYIAVAARHPDRTIVQIIHEVFGPVAGRLLSGALLLYLAYLASLVVTNYVDFLTTALFKFTPAAAIVVPMVFLCVYAVRKGIEVIARCAMILLPVAVAAILFSDALTINLTRIDRILPLLDLLPSTLLHSAHTIAAFPLNETVAFGMIIPFLTTANRSRRSIITGVVLGSIYLSFAAFRVHSVLGAAAQATTYPIFQSVRLIRTGNFLTRLEILVAVNVMTMGFMKATILLYGSALGVSQWFGLKSYGPVVAPLGILILLASIMNFHNVFENIAFAERVYPIFALPFELGIPLLTLLGSLVKAAGKRSGTCDVKDH